MDSYIHTYILIVCCISGHKEAICDLQSDQDHLFSSDDSGSIIIWMGINKKLKQMIVIQGFGFVWWTTTPLTDLQSRLDQVQILDQIKVYRLEQIGFYRLDNIMIIIIIFVYYKLTERSKGPSIYDVHKQISLFYPLSPCPHASTWAGPPCPLWTSTCGRREYTSLSWNG